MDPMDGVDPSSEVGIAIQQFSHSVDALRGAFEWLGRTGIDELMEFRIFCFRYPTFLMGAMVEMVEKNMCSLSSFFERGGGPMISCRYLSATRHPPGRNPQSVHNAIRFDLQGKDAPVPQDSWC